MRCPSCGGPLAPGPRSPWEPWCLPCETAYRPHQKTPVKAVLGAAVVGCVAVATTAMIVALPVWGVVAAALAVTVPPLPMLRMLVRRERRRHLESKVPAARLLNR